MNKFYYTIALIFTMLSPVQAGMIYNSGDIYLSDYDFEYGEIEIDTNYENLSLSLTIEGDFSADNETVFEFYLEDIEIVYDFDDGLYFDDSTGALVSSSVSDTLLEIEISIDDTYWSELIEDLYDDLAGALNKI